LSGDDALPRSRMSVRAPNLEAALAEFFAASLHAGIGRSVSFGRIGADVCCKRRRACRLWRDWHGNCLNETVLAGFAPRAHTWTPRFLADRFLPNFGPTLFASAFFFFVARGAPCNGRMKGSAVSLK
jgi:hypothetical protein